MATTAAVIKSRCNGRSEWIRTTDPLSPRKWVRPEFDSDCAPLRPNTANTFLHNYLILNVFHNKSINLEPVPPDIHREINGFTLV